MHPLKNFAITAPFDWRPAVGSTVWQIYQSHGLIGHNGVDYAPRSADWNIYSICSGTVQAVGFEANGVGHFIIIRSDATFEGTQIDVLYGHMQEATHLSRGSRVAEGAIVGRVGNSGVATGSHLHIGCGRPTRNRNDGYLGWSINPTAFINFLSGQAQGGGEVVVEGDKKFFTTQYGGWRSNVISEIINAGIWSGTWQERQPLFDSMNPVAPPGGWKRGDKVVIEVLPPKKKEVEEASAGIIHDEPVNIVVEPVIEQAPEKPVEPIVIESGTADTPLDVEIIENVDDLSLDSGNEMERTVISPEALGDKLKSFQPYGTSTAFLGASIGVIIAYKYNLPTEIALAVASVVGYIVNTLMIIGVELLRRI
jgi:hypothetical protein